MSEIARIKQYFRGLRHRLIDFFYNKLCKWDYHLKGNPRWAQSNVGGATHAYYWGECRLCKDKITPIYQFKNLNGPVFEGVPMYKERRDLEALIHNCIDLFIKKA